MAEHWPKTCDILALSPSTKKAEGIKKNNKKQTEKWLNILKINELL